MNEQQTQRPNGYSQRRAATAEQVSLNVAEVAWRSLSEGTALSDTDKATVQKVGQAHFIRAAAQQWREAGRLDSAEGMKRIMGDMLKDGWGTQPKQAQREQMAQRPQKKTAQVAARQTALVSQVDHGYGM